VPDAIDDRAFDPPVRQAHDELPSRHHAAQGVDGAFSREVLDPRVTSEPVPRPPPVLGADHGVVVPGKYQRARHSEGEPGQGRYGPAGRDPACIDGAEHQESDGANTTTGDAFGGLSAGTLDRGVLRFASVGGGFGVVADHRDSNVQITEYVGAQALGAKIQREDSD